MGSVLCLGSVFDLCTRERCVLFLLWYGVLELFERFLDVAWHRQVDLPSLVIPIDGDADVPCSSPVFGDCIMFFERLLEMQLQKSTMVVVKGTRLKSEHHHGLNHGGFYTS